MKMDKKIVFMSKHDIEIKNSIPTKTVLSENILEKNIKKQYVIDSMVEKDGSFFPRFPPYHCILNLEMV